MELNKEVMIPNDSCCNVSTTFELVKDKYLRNFHGKPIVHLKPEIFIFSKYAAMITLPTPFYTFSLSHILNDSTLQTIFSLSFLPSLRTLRFPQICKKLHFPKYFVFQTNFKPSINSNLIFQHIYNEINLHVTLSHTHNLYSASPILTASSNFCDLNQFFMHFHI